MEAAEKAIRCHVTGRVQGVFFRASTAERARALALRGWVRNCADGSVEVAAAGPDDALAELVRWLWSGPPAARVASVATETCEEAFAERFEIR
jgi:acylphosphatase